MKKILVINPIATDRWNETDKKILQSDADSSTVIDLVSLERGPETIESFYDEAFAAPEILKIAGDKKDDYDGIMVNCFADPALHALREICDIPVTGPCESSLIVASMLGHNFSIISVMEKMLPLFEMRCRAMGLDRKLNTIRYVDIHVKDLEKDAEKTVAKIVGEIEIAVDNNTEVAVLGCTGMMPLYEKVKKEIEIPIVEPAKSALKMLEDLIDMGIKHNKMGLYMQPDVEKIIGY